MEFTMKISGMEQVTAMLDKRVARMAVISGTNHTARKVRTAGMKAVRKIYNIKTKDIKPTIWIVKATRSKPYALFKVWGYRLGVAKFSAKQTKRGVTFKIKKGGGRKRIGKAFIATMASGHVGVFKREGKSRLPIDEKLTISVPEMFGSKKVTTAMQTVINRDLAARVWRDYKYRIERNAKRK